MANNEQIEQFLEICEECTSHTVDEMVINSKWGTINFEKSRGDMERMQSILNHFKVLPLDLLPDASMNEIINAAKPVQNALEPILAFTIEQQDPAAARESLVAGLKSAVDQLYIKGHLWVPYLAYQKGDVERNINELSKSVSDANEIVTKAKDDISSKNEEIQDIISTAREASASVGVAHFTGDFSDEAKSMAGVARNWLIATGILAAGTLLAAFLMMSYSSDVEVSNSQLIQYTTSKLVFLGLLFTATVWSGRIYKATLHQVSTNKHRANALKTFQAFVKATDDETARDAVLMETTRSIFTLANSGYLEGEKSQNDGGIKIVEVVKNASQTVSASTKASE